MADGIPDPVPVEIEFPELAAALVQIANGNHPMVRGLDISAREVRIRLKNGSMRVRRRAPNDPCPCGSGKKFKKCCGK